MLSLLIAAFLAACAQPVDGPLPEGVWGAEDLKLTVSADGHATMERTCSSADLGSPSAVDDVLHVEFEWLLSPGDQPDSGTDFTTDAVLDATIDVHRVSGTMTESGQTTDVELVAGVDTTFYACP